MAYSFKTFNDKVREVHEWLKKELMGIQTGRATPAILDGVMVDSYGARVAVNQLANITIEDARTLRIVPWDKDSVRNIEVALREADIGLGIAVDDQGVRASFPELTTETREKFVKVVKQKLEDARITLRHERDDVWNALQDQEKEGTLSKDEKFRLKEEMEKITKEANDALEELAERKEKDIVG